ncbi:MAG: methionine--tRNA ligase [Deltaproteobacteria bacterium]|nr:methionine--tRNA ligase [Deltaproteobacteria bacterium]HCH62300.1 methionine--tRNA ligase [Deltaproteobacteria bacterium]
MSRNILVTAALPYANGPIHIGHLVEYVQADIWVRYQKLTGNDCKYICADDAHGTPIMLSARKRGIDPQQLIDEMHASHSADFRDFFVEFDIFHSTHSEENRICASKIYNRLKDGGYIARKAVAQAYDEQAKMFLPDRFVKGVCPKCESPDQYGDACEVCGATYAPLDLINPRSVLTGTKPVVRKSEHLFIELAKFETFLQSWVKDHVQPEVANKLEEWFEAGLRDWDISREAPYWGFQIPGETDKFFYVWLDAPIGYMGSHWRWCKDHGREDEFEAAWKPDSDIELVQFLGKDIAYFHTLFWPAVLHGSGHRTPTQVYCHGFLTVDGRKMSKSRGTFIAARTWLEHLDPQALRYYLASKLASGVDDIDLSLDDFVFRVNSDLVGKVVNIASRCAGILRKRYGNRLSAALDDTEMYAEFAAARTEVGERFEAREYAKAIRAITALADRTNKYIDTKAPWALCKAEDTFEEGHRVCTQGLNLFRVLITMLSPVVPKLAEDSFALLQSPLSWDGLDTPLLDAEIQKFKPLMLRVDKAHVAAVVEASKPAEPPPAPEPAAPAYAPVADTISFDEFMKVDLRVATVVEAEIIEKANKLLRLTVDLGFETRQVIAGIRKAYNPEHLIGKQVVVVANLAPRKMKFGVSEGMVIAAGPGAPDIFLLGVDNGALNGMRIK